MTEARSPIGLESQQRSESAAGEPTIRRSLLDHAPVAMMVVADDDCCRYLNDRAAQLLGISAARAARGHLWHRWVSASQHDRVLSQWQQAKSQRLAFQAVCELESDGPPARRVRLEATPDAASSDYVFVIHLLEPESAATAEPKPLAPRSDAEELRLLDSLEHKLRMTAFSVDSCSTCVFWLRRDASFIYVNDAAVEAFGYSRDELLTMSVHQIDPNYNEDIWPDFWSNVKQHQSLTFESSMRSKDGQLIPVEITTNYLDYEGEEFVFAFIADITARKQMEETLRANAERLDLAMSITNNGIYDWDVPANQLFFDHRFYTMAGYEPDEFPANYNEWAKRVHPDDLPDASGAVNDFLGGRLSAYDKEFRFLRKDGDWMWVRARVRVVDRDSSNKPLRVVGTYTDVTEWRKTQDSLRSREQHIRRLLDSLPQLIWVASGPDKRCTQFNKQWLDYTGRTLAQELGDGWTANVHPDDLMSCLKTHAEAFTRRRQYDTEYRLRGADGRYRWFLDAGLPWYEADGSFAGFIGASVDITDRKEAEEALRQSESQYADLYENSPDMMCSIDATDGTILHCNRKMAETLGYSKREILGQPVFPLIAPESKRRVRDELFPEFQATGRLDGEELRFQCRDGSHCDVILNSTAVRDENGKIICSRSVLKDVTERLSTQRALRRSEEMFRDLVQTAPFGVQRNDFDGRITFASETLGKIYGANADDLVGRSVLQFALDEDARQAMQHYMAKQRVDPVAPPRTFVTRNRTVDGRTIDVSIDWTFDRDAAGTPVGFIVVVTDITDRKDFERALEFQADVLNRVSDAVLVTDRRGNVSYANETARRLCGLDANDKANEKLWNLHRELFLVADFDRKVREELRSNGVWEGEKELRIGTEVRFFEMKLKLFPSPSGSEQLLLSVIRDVSARHQAEQENRQHREMLAHVARLSTMGELVAGIAHEVKQPLYAISNFCTAAAVGLKQLDPAQPTGEERLEGLRECNDGIRHASVRANEIIRRLREFARRSERQYENVNLNRVVHESVKLVAFKARECMVEVELQLQDDLPSVIADRIQCEQVLVNLLNNAYEAMAESAGPHRVVVRSRSHDDHVEVQVSDNGPGIGQHEHGKLFEAFYTTKYHGMGMGLAISRTIVEDHGGRLSATTNHEGGATFRVVLPRRTVGHNSWTANS